MTEWMTVEQATEYFQMGKSAGYKVVRERRIPAHKAGREWRFDLAELDEWLKSGIPSPPTCSKPAMTFEPSRSDVKTTMIYTHVLNPPEAGWRSQPRRFDMRSFWKMLCRSI